MKVTLHPRDIPEEIAKAVVVESVGLHGMDTRAIVSWWILCNKSSYSAEDNELETIDWSVEMDVETLAWWAIVGFYVYSDNSPLSALSSCNAGIALCHVQQIRDFVYVHEKELPYIVYMRLP